MLALVAFSAGLAFANEPGVIWPTPEAGLERVQARETVAYREVLAEFDAAMLASPKDPAIAVARCEFIAQFTDEEYGDWIEAASIEFELCSEALRSKWPKEPVVRLFALDQLWGEEAAELGEELLADANDWPSPLRKHLLAKTSQAYEAGENTERAGDLAVMASRLGEGSRVPSAVDHLVAKREFAAAEALLRDTPAATAQWQATRRVSAAFGLPNRHAALAELRRYQSAAFDVDVAIAAHAYLRAGEVTAARTLLQEETGTWPSLQQARFDAALAVGDMGAAAGLIDLTDMENFADNLQRFAVLATQAPGTMLSRQMLFAAFIALIMLTMLALVPGLAFVPVHYRGLIRRVRGNPATPLFEGIGLRHAWLGAAVMVCVPMVVAALVEPHSLATLLAGETLPESDALFRITLWGGVIGLLCLLPAACTMGMRQLIGDSTTLRAWWRVLLAWIVLIGISAIVAAWNSNAGDTQTMQTKMIDSLVSVGRDTYGALVTLLMIALLVPVFEELVFRGFVLGGMTRYIGFGWANTAQAALFAGVHDDLPRFPFYFAMGLLGGWLVKKTRALSPAIALHGANNALMFSLRLFTS